MLDGDRSLFTSSEGLEAAWNTLQPLLDARPEVQPYEQGSWGPQAGTDLAAPAGWLLQQQ